jgi:hypothetical protein
VQHLKDRGQYTSDIIILDMTLDSHTKKDRGTEEILRFLRLIRGLGNRSSFSLGIYLGQYAKAEL